MVVVLIAEVGEWANVLVVTDENTGISTFPSGEWPEDEGAEKAMSRILAPHIDFSVSVIGELDEYEDDEHYLCYYCAVSNSDAIIPPTWESVTKAQDMLPSSQDRANLANAILKVMGADLPSHHNTRI